MATATITVQVVGRREVANSITITVERPATIVSIGQGSTRSVTNGARGTLTATVLPLGHTDGEVSWTSSATNFVTIDASSGAYRAVGVGTATITARVGSVTDTIAITVQVHSIAATNISINTNDFTIANGRLVL